MENGIKALLQRHVNSVDLSEEVSIENLLVAGVLELMKSGDKQSDEISLLKKFMYTITGMGIVCAYFVVNNWDKIFK